MMCVSDCNFEISQMMWYIENESSQVYDSITILSTWRGHLEFAAIEALN